MHAFFFIFGLAVSLTPVLGVVLDLPFNVSGVIEQLEEDIVPPATYDVELGYKHFAFVYACPNVTSENFNFTVRNVDETAVVVASESSAGVFSSYGPGVVFPLGGLGDNVVVPVNTFRLSFTSLQTAVFSLFGFEGERLDTLDKVDIALEANTSTYRGLKVVPAQLPLAIAVIPSQGDLDLVVSRETKPLAAVPEGSDLKGPGVEEWVYIDTQFKNFFEDEMMIIQVFAPDGQVAAKGHLEFHKNFQLDPLIGLSVIGIVGALIILALCLFTGIVAIIARSRQQQDGADAAIGMVQVDESATAAEINALPIRAFKVGMCSKEDAKCCICLEEYKLNTKLRELPCQHHFHRQCVDEWLKEHNRLCPLCKHDITKPKEEEEEEGTDSIHGESSELKEEV